MASHPFNGVVLVNKPTGMTSHDVVSRMRRYFGLRKVGHTGSLDPLATGMLPVCLGQGTKFSQFLLDADKQYTVTARLGQMTDTGDADGQVIDEQSLPADLSVTQIKQVLQALVGKQQQIPPMYSAIKHQGQPLYKLARAGKHVERQPRPITIHDLTLLSFDAPLITLTAEVSKGTYIRVLVEEIGKQLGCGAHVTVLHRDWVHPFQQVAMHELSDIEAMMGQAKELAGLVIPIEKLLVDLPAITIPGLEKLAALNHGQAIDADIGPLMKDDLVCVFDGQQQFLGVGVITAEQQLRAKRWLVG